MINIATIKNTLGRKFRGASIDDIQGISDFSIFREAASNLLSRIDPYETVRTHRFNLFTDVTEYEPPEDLKSKKVIDPAPQEENGEDFSQTFTKEFRKDRELYKVLVEFIDGSKVLKVRAPGRGTSLRTDNTNDTTGWLAAAGATDLEIDSVIRLDKSDSLRFDLGAAGGYIENSTLDLINLSAHENISSFFRKVYIPAGSGDITSITLRIGSASGAYWAITGAPHFGEWKDGINLIRFDWADAVPTGSPDSSIVSYERFTIATGDSIADVRVGPLTSRLPLPYETPYYSNCLFRQKDEGDWLEEPTNDDDEIQLEHEAQNIFFYECCVLVAEDLSLDTDALKFYKHLGVNPVDGTLTKGGLYGNYMEDKPTEKLRPTSHYIDLRDRRTRRSIRRRF